METIYQGAVAGLIAALAATTVLGLAKYVLLWWARRQDINYIRKLLIERSRLVMEAKDTFIPPMVATISADGLRATQYNRMVKELGIALERWTVHLSHAQRKDIYDALDWYHYDPDKLFATKKGGVVKFVELPNGIWLPPEMPMEVANRKLKNLQSIRWLKLNEDFNAFAQSADKHED